MKSRIRKRRTLRKGARAGPVRRGAAPAPAERRERPVLIGGMHDPAEKTADRAAAQALAGGPVTAAAPGGGAIHRECAECEKDKEAKRSPAPTATVASGTTSARAGGEASSAITMLGMGRPLDRAERSFFEPRFGKDFSSVRLHDGAAADKAARAIDARAFTWGSDIAFATGEREKGGPRLMAHELAHVAADEGGGARREVRRATISRVDGTGVFRAVPAGHVRRVQRALDIVERAIGANRCRNFFRDNCSAGALDSAQRAFDAANIFFLNDRTNRTGLSELPQSVGYNELRYDIGHWALAQTFLHEIFHTCDLSFDANDEILAESAAQACRFYTPWINNASPSSVSVGDTVQVLGLALGDTQDAQHYLELGGTQITTYNSWAQNAASGIEISFNVPASAAPSGPSHTLDLVAVNNTIRSNVRSVEVLP